MTITKRTCLLAGIAVALAILLLGLWFGLSQKPPEVTPEPTQTTEATAPPITANVFTPMDFGYVHGYLTCLTAPSIRGIDVSTHQKEIDWEQVRAAGFEFVMLRVGWRGSVEGLMFEDELAQTHYKGAKAAGLKVGGYFFSQSISPEEAREEAEFALSIVADWELDMPLVYDWEFIQTGYRTDVVDARILTDCTKAFCETVEQAGYEAMVYFNPEQSRKQMYLEELTDYGFWLAMYSDEMTYEYKVDMWQHTNTGTVPGIDGDVDMNLYFPKETP